VIEHERDRATIVVEISPGELLDRLSILRLKAERIKAQRWAPPVGPETGVDREKRRQGGR
jgi:hypothetical protein